MLPLYKDVSLFDFFNKITSFTSDKNEAGVTRLAYSAEDESAHKYVIDMLRKMHLDVRQDSMGNVFARLPGKDNSLPAIGTGSHLDSVPKGGAYDGVVGVITGLYAITQFSPRELNHPLELVIFRAEESSRFGFACMGSKALVGAADLVKWKKNFDSDGKNIFTALSDNGYDGADISGCRLPDDYFCAFVESHIEQGRVLEKNGSQIGLVYGIAAPSRYRVEIRGHADHSGATPMSQRHDALVAAAMVVSDIYHASCSESTYGTVGTVGKLDVSPNAMNVIPGDVSFYVDVRGVDKDSIDRVIRKFKASVDKISIDHDVKIEIHELARDQPVLLDHELCSLMAEVCKENQVPAMDIMSGAGHDAMYMASRFPTAMIFIPSKDGVSHHPDEFSDWKYIETAAEVLKKSIAKIDKLKCCNA